MESMSALDRTGQSRQVPAVYAALAVTSLATAAIHFAVIGEHFADYLAFGVFFAVVAWLQALWGTAVAVAPSRGLLFAGLVGNAVVVAIWVASRTSGLPIGPEPGTPEPIAFLDLLSTILEVLIIVGAAVLLIRRRHLQFLKNPKAGLIVLGLTMALGVLTTAAIATGGHDENASEATTTEHHDQSTP